MVTIQLQAPQQYLRILMASLSQYQAPLKRINPFQCRVIAMRNQRLPTGVIAFGAHIQLKVGARLVV